MKLNYGIEAKFDKIWQIWLNIIFKLNLVKPNKTWQN
jgi:hypothetical protein